MFQEILRLSRQTLIYGVGNVLTRLVAFLLLPIFTHHLSPDRFAVYVLFYMSIAVAMEVVRLGMDIALLRYYVLEQDQARRRVIFSTIFWVALVVSTALGAVLWLGARSWVGLIIASAEPHPEWMIYTLKLCAGIMWFDNMSAFPLVVMRGEGQAGRFTTVKLAGVTAQVGLTVLFLVGMNRGVAGIFEANLLSSALILGFCLPTIIRRLRPALDRMMLKACLAFGLPNVPNALFVITVELADRKILELLRGTVEAGLYSAGYRLGMFLAIVATGFRFAWQPFFLQVSDRPDARQVYARVLTYYLAIVGWLYLLLTAFIEPLVRWDIPGVGPLIDPEFWPGLGVFPVVLLAHVWSGVYAVFIVGIYLKKKTRALPIITGAAAVINIGGNLLLVPVWGMWASAWLTVVSYAVMALFLYLYISRHYFIRFEWGRVAHLTVVAGLTFAAGAVGRHYGTQWAGYILSVTYPLILLASGLATPGERARLRLQLK